MKTDLGPADDNPTTLDYTTLPNGTYVCKIAEVRPGTTRNGDPRWGIRLVVAEGEFVGRQAAWDGIVFSDRARPRTRTILHALGLPSSGVVDIDPDDLVGRSALVKIRAEEYTDPDTGVTTRRNRVPFDGFIGMPDHAGDRAADGDDDDVNGVVASIPF